MRLFNLLSSPPCTRNFKRGSILFSVQKDSGDTDLVYQHGELLIQGSKIIRVGKDIEKPKNSN